MRFGYSLLTLATIGGGGTTLALSSKSPNSQKVHSQQAKVVDPAPAPQSEVKLPALSPQTQPSSPDLSIETQAEAIDPDSLTQSKTVTLEDLSSQVLSVIPQILSAQEPTSSVELPTPSLDQSPASSSVPLTVLEPAIYHQEAEVSLQQSSDPLHQSPDISQELPESPQLRDSLSQKSDLLPEPPVSSGLEKSHLEEEPHRDSDPLSEELEDEFDEAGNCQFMSFSEVSSNIPKSFNVTEGDYFSVLCTRGTDSTIFTDNWAGLFPKEFFDINWEKIENKRISIQVADIPETDPLSLQPEEDEELFWIRITSPKIVENLSLNAKFTYYSGDEEGEDDSGTWGEVETVSAENKKVYLLMRGDGESDDEA